MVLLWLTGTPSEPRVDRPLLPGEGSEPGAARQCIRDLPGRRAPRAILGPVASDPEPPIVGQPAPLFSLTSVQGGTIDLATYRGRSNVVVWFSRGFTCPFCRVYTDGVRAGYDALRDTETEVIQIAPNLLDSARRYFGESVLPFPFVSDPDKRLYALYGLGDLPAL